MNFGSFSEWASAQPLHRRGSYGWLASAATKFGDAVMGVISNVTATITPTTKTPKVKVDFVAKAKARAEAQAKINAKALEMVKAYESKTLKAEAKAKAAEVAKVEGDLSALRPMVTEAKFLLGVARSIGGKVGRAIARMAGLKRLQGAMVKALSKAKDSLKWLSSAAALDARVDANLAIARRIGVV
jgi:hypothetical protein